MGLTWGTPNGGKSAMRDKAKKSSGGGSPHERNRPAPTPKAKRKAKPKGGVAHVKTVSKPKAVVAPTPKPKPKVVTTPAPAAKIVAVPKPKVVIAPKPKVEPKVEPKAKATPSPTAVKPGTGSAAAIKPKVEVKPKPVVQPKPEPKAEPINHPAQKEVAVIKPAPKPAPAPVPKVEAAPKPKAKPKGGLPHVLTSTPATPTQKVEMDFLKSGLPPADTKDDLSNKKVTALSEPKNHPSQKEIAVLTEPADHPSKKETAVLPKTEPKVETKVEPKTVVNKTTSVEPKNHPSQKETDGITNRAKDIIKSLYDKQATKEEVPKGLTQQQRDQKTANAKSAHETQTDDDKRLEDRTVEERDPVNIPGTKEYAEASRERYFESQKKPVKTKVKIKPKRTSWWDRVPTNATTKPKVEVKAEPITKPKVEVKVEPKDHPSQKETAVIETKPATKVESKATDEALTRKEGKLDPVVAPKTLSDKEMEKEDTKPSILLGDTKKSTEPKDHPSQKETAVIETKPATKATDEALTRKEKKLDPVVVAEPVDHPSQKETAVLPKVETKTDSHRSILFDPTSRDKFVNDKTKGTKEWKEDHKAELDKNATKDRVNLSKDNETVAEEPKYDQKYWADKLAKGKADGNDNIQADLKKEQDSIGIKKAYSGDKVVTEDMSRKANDDLKRVTGSMAVIDDPDMSKADKADLIKAGILVGGVKKTEEKSGLFDRNVKTTYDYKGGPSIVTKSDDPKIGGVRFGEKTSTTFVDGVEVATKTGHDPLGKDAVVTKPDIAGHIDDTQAIDPVQATEEIGDINEQIKTETDPVKLKALHQRRLRLMRMMRTNTRFAGLLDDADTKRSNLMSIG